jgi:hypothetical protein
VLQEYVRQEYVFENPTICERDVGCSPVIREVEFVFSGDENPYRKWSAREDFVVRGDDISVNIDEIMFDGKERQRS